jgi:nucleotide-binding universal stress UspA family protein
MTTKPVVTGTDGSEESLCAVEWAAGEAVLHAVPLRIVSATSLLPWTTGLQVRPDRDHVADLIRAEREQALDTAASRAARVAPGLVIITDPLDGVPAHAVAESGYGALMLVVGSRGAGAFTPMMLGSVSRHVAAHAA